MKSIKLGLAVIGMSVFLAAPVAHADSAEVSLNQAIEAPISKLSFQNSSGTDIVQPHLNFPLRTARYICQKDDKAPTSTLGTPDQKLFASIPDRSAAGWDVSIAPTNGVSSGWQGVGGGLMRIDDTTNEGCGDGPNSTSKGGLLNIDTSAMKVIDDCAWTCADPIFLTKSQSTNFGNTRSVSLFSSATPHVGWEGTISDVVLRQTIPAGQAADEYHLPLTVTLTEL